MLPESIHGSEGGFSQQGLALGKELLDGSRIGRARRQIAQLCPCRFDGFAYASHFVTAQVVGNDDVAGPERGTEEIPDVGQKRCPIHRAIHERSRQAVMAQSGERGGGLPVTVRNGTDTALPLVGPAIAPRHPGAGAGFVKKHQPRGIKLALPSLPLTTRLLHVRPFLLAGVQGFFLGSSPSGWADATEPDS